MAVGARSRAVLTSRSLRTGGQRRRIRVTLPLLRGAVAVESERLFVAGDTGVVTGQWCGSYDEDAHGGDSGCVETQPFFARFSTRTGRVVEERLPDQIPEVLDGDRISEVVPTPGAPSAVRDVLDGRTTMTLPSDAEEVQGAGAYVSWQSGRTDSHDADQVNVAVRNTGTIRYRLPFARMARAMHVPASGEHAPVFDVLDLTSNGATTVEALTGGVRGGRPIIVDEHGRLHALHGRYSNLGSFMSSVRGRRVLLRVDAQDPGTRCDRVETYLTSRTGRTGNTLRGASRLLRRSDDGFAAFASPSELLARNYGFQELMAGGPLHITAATNIVRASPLTRREQPRC